VEKKRSDFNEGFVEGRFEPLTVFARRCNLKFTDEELLIHHIQAVLGFTVVVDPDDGVTKGVEILDHAPGVKRFRRGAGHYASKSEKTTYDTEGEVAAEARRMADEHAAHLGGEVRCRSGAHAPRADGVVMDDGAPEEEEVSTPPTGSGLRFGGPLVQAVSDTLREDDDGLGPQDSISCVGRQSRASSGSASFDVGRQRAVVTPVAEASRDGGDGISKASDVTKPRRPRRSGPQLAIENAKAMRDKLEQSHSWEKHMESASRHRDFMALMIRTGSLARKAGEISSNPEAAEISDSLFEVKETLEGRQRFFDRCKEDFPSVVLEPSLDDKAHMLMSTRPGMMSLLTTNIHYLIENIFDRDVGDKCVHAFAVALNAFDARDGPLQTSFGILGRLRQGGRGPEGLAQAVSEGQKNATLSLADKLLKSSDVKLIVGVMQLLDAHLPCMTTAPIETVDVKAPFKMLENGWYPQAWVDMYTVRSIGLMLAASLKHESGDVDSIERSIRQIFINVVENAAKVSPRLKAQTRSICGMQVQHGKTAWDKMVHIHSEFSRVTSMCQGEAFEKVQQLVEAFEGALKEGPEASYSVLFDAMEDVDTVATIKQLGAVFGDCATRVEDVSVVGMDGADVEHMRDKHVGLMRDLARLMLHLGNDVMAFCEQQQLSVLFEYVFSNREASDLYTYGLSDRQPDVPDEALSPLEFLAFLTEYFAMLVPFKLPDGVQELRIACASAVSIAADIHHGKDAVESFDFDAAVGFFVKAWTKTKGFDPKSACANLPCPNDAAAETARHWVLIGTSSAEISAYVKLLYTMDTYDVGACIVSVLSGVVGRGVHKKLADLFGQFSSDLPEGALPVLKAQAAFERLEEATAKRANGKSPGGLLDLTITMQLATEAEKLHPTLVSVRPNFQRNIGQLRADWDATFNRMIDKVNQLDLMEQFVHAYTGIYKAVEKWDFSSYPDLTKTTQPKEVDKGAQAVNSAATQLQTWKNMCSQLPDRMKGWADEQATKIKTFNDKVQEYEEMCNQAAKILSCCCVLPRVIALETAKDAQEIKAVDEKLAEMNKYISGTLRCKFEDFPPNLKKKLAASDVFAPHRGQDEKMSDAAETVESSSIQAASSASVTAPAQKGIGGPRKKLLQKKQK
ncbi:unnamed protein product, partial [Prorocentrum cordatum]